MKLSFEAFLCVIFVGYILLLVLLAWSAGFIAKKYGKNAAPWRCGVLCFLLAISAGCVSWVLSKNSFTSHKRIQKTWPHKNTAKYSNFRKDGVLYHQYDIGKAVFTVDARDFGDNLGEETERYWYWPGLLSSGRISSEQLNKSSEIRVRANFYEIGRYQDTYTSWGKTEQWTDIYKPAEIESDIKGLRKFTSSSKNIMYMPIDETIKTPQGTPLVFWCYPETLPTPRLTCEVVFHYYDQVAVVIEFNGDVILPEWHKLTVNIDNFFKSRFEEK